MIENNFIYQTHDELIAELIIAGKPIAELVKQIVDLYLSDDRSWVIGFSGGKDSTCVLSLVFTALIKISPEKRNKPIYVVSSDTLVETPVVVDLINKVLDIINDKAAELKLPISAHPVHPAIDQTFWVNLLGRGYPAPQQTFRWCTERMKINPVSEFITDKVAKHGEVIVALGSRSKESASRSQVIDKHQIKGSLLARHTSLPNAYTYMPIVDWDADDVWEYLMSAPCPWGGTNETLFELYKGSNQGECPLVIDKSTPSCGNSRFGCWTCTVVTKDKALHGLIESGEEWMRPLLEFRNDLHNSTRPEKKDKYRNFKRRTGKVSYQKGSISDEITGDKKHVPGPYWLKQRKKWLKRLLEIEKGIKASGQDLNLIQRKELVAIRNQWLQDPNEPDWMDSLPAIFSEVYPEESIVWDKSHLRQFSEEDNNVLKLLCEEEDIVPEMIVKLLSLESEMSGLSVRRDFFSKLERILNGDWGTLEQINTKNKRRIAVDIWEDTLQELRNELKEVR